MVSNGQSEAVDTSVQEQGTPILHCCLQAFLLVRMLELKYEQKFGSFSFQKQLHSACRILEEYVALATCLQLFRCSIPTTPLLQEKSWGTVILKNMLLAELIQQSLEK